MTARLVAQNDDDADAESSRLLAATASSQKKPLLMDDHHAGPISSSSSRNNQAASTDENSHHQQSSSSSSALWITYINIVLYAMCYQLQRPVEPFLVQKLAQDAEKNKHSSETDIRETFGQLQSFFSAIQTVGSPLVGILLDRVGIRYTSACVFLASALSYAILAVATDMRYLFYSKIPTAMQHAFLVAQAVAATCSHGSDAARAAALARMTTAYTVGATLGPALGGFLAEQGDLYAGARLAVMGSLVSVGLSLVYLPTTTTTTTTTGGGSGSVGNNNNTAIGAHHDNDDNKIHTKKTRTWMHEMQRAAALGLRPNLWPLLLIKVTSGVASSMHSTALPLVLQQQLHYDPATLGFNMSVSMLSVAVAGAVAVQPLTRRLGAAGMAQSGLMLRSVLGLVLATIVSLNSSSRKDEEAAAAGQTQILLLATTCAIHGLATHALATGLTTCTTGAVSIQEQGSLLGLEHGLFSLARVYGPTAGTKLLSSSGGFWNVEQVCGGMDVALVVVLAMAVSNLSSSSAAARRGTTGKNKSP